MNRSYSLISFAALGSLLVFATSCGKGAAKNVKIDGVEGPKVNFVDNKLTMSVVLKNASIDIGARVPIPYLPNSFLEVGPDLQSNGYLIHLGLDPQDIAALAKDNFKVLDPTRLPGGRALPGVADGELPAIAVQVPKLDNIVFYMGPKVIGAFIPVKLPWKDYMGSFRFYDDAGDRIGNIAIVGLDKSDANSGFLLLINLDGKVGKLAKLN